jgi:hypothetical protein
MMSVRREHPGETIIRFAIGSAESPGKASRVARAASAVIGSQGFVGVRTPYLTPSHAK